MKKAIIKGALYILIPISMILCITIVEQHILSNDEFSLEIKKGDLSYLKNVEIEGNIYINDDKIIALNLKNGKLNCENIYWKEDFAPITLSSQYWDASYNCQKERLLYKRGSKKNVTKLSAKEESLLKKVFFDNFQYKQVGQADFVFDEVVGNELKPVETYTLKTQGSKKLIEIIHNDKQESDVSHFLYVDFSKEIIWHDYWNKKFDYIDIMNHTIQDMYYKNHKLYVLWIEYENLPKLHINVYEKNLKVFDAEIQLIKERKVENPNITPYEPSTIYKEFKVVR